MAKQTIGTSLGKNKISLIDVDYYTPTHELWIADDVCIECKAFRIKWWHRFFIQLFFGWKYKKIGGK